MRLMITGRQGSADDERPEIIHRRPELYRSTTQPLLDRYAALLIPIDGTGAVADVQSRVLAALTDRPGPTAAHSGESEPVSAASSTSTTHNPLWPRPGWAAR